VWLLLVTLFVSGTTAGVTALLVFVGDDDVGSSLLKILRPAIASCVAANGTATHCSDYKHPQTRPYKAIVAVQFE